MLAAGLHPRLLTERGLVAAVDALAARSRTETRVTVDGGRLPATVEGGAYFVCSEALANVDKHAAATSASVVVTIVGDRVVRIDVCDNGVGGADPAHRERAAQPGRPGPRPRRHVRPHQSPRRRDVSGGGVAGG